MTQEEFDKKKKTEQGEKRKARKNNGAKRDMHYEILAFTSCHPYYTQQLSFPVGRGGYLC